MNRAQEELESVLGLDSLLEESILPPLPFLQSIVKEILDFIHMLLSCFWTSLWNIPH